MSCDTVTQDATILRLSIVSLQDLFNAFNCTCAPGFIGGQCQVDVNDCEIKQPCLNGGTCFDVQNDYICVCIQGEYTVSKHEAYISFQ